MGSLSTFGMFTTARLGIYVSQHALSVTGNNISNINTKGYTRQELDQVSMYYGTADRYHSRFDIRSNGGVLATGVGQTRDKYLDIRYRNEMTRVGTMDAAVGGYERLSDIFDEVAAGEDGEGVLEARFNDFIQQMEMLGRDESAGKDDIDFIVRDAAEALTIQFNDYANQLRNLKDLEAASLRDQVGEINTTLTKIRNLNESIRRARIFGDSALVQRDERNLLIDSLSEKIGINVEYVAESLGDGVEVEKLRISTKGDPSRMLVDGLYATQLSIRDQEGFGINLSALLDSKGKEDPTTYNNLERVIPDVETAQRGIMDKTQASAFTKETADELVSYMNASSAFKTKFPGVTCKVEALGDNSGKYVIVADDKGDPDDYLKLDVKPLYQAAGSATSLGTDLTAAQAAGLSTFSKEEAQQLSDYLNANEEFIHDGDRTYAYHVKEMPDGSGKYYIGRHDITGDKTIDETPCEYTRIELVRQTKLTDTELTGGLQAQRELLTEKGVYATATDLEMDKDAATKRGIPYYQKALDTLANTFATMMNRANTLTDEDTCYMKDGKYTDANGTELADQTKRVVKEEFRKYFQQDANGFVDANGAAVGGLDQPVDYSKLVHEAKYEKYFGGNLFSNRGTGDDAESPEITAANISISLGWAEGKMHVLPTKDPDADIKSRAQDNTAHMISMLNSRHKFTVANGGQGETFFEGKFQEMLTDSIAGSLAKDQSVTSTMLKNYTTAADELYVDRDAIMGVDLNDEAMNMMQFQKAYSAACRLMTTYDDMLERLINNMAV